MDLLGCYREIWCVDFEFRAPDGHRPEPRCVVARELRSGRVVRRWLGDDPPPVPPYSIKNDSLFVAFFASAELGCHLALGWPMPTRILDLYAEFRNLTNGRTPRHGNGLLGALSHFGLDALDATEKDGMRALAMRDGTYTAAERTALLDYCQTDVDALINLLPRMLPHIDIPRALLRGRFMAAVARMEWTGTPIDGETMARIRHDWEQVKSKLVLEVDEDYRVFIPADRTLDPTTRFGVAVFDAANECSLDPYMVADAAEYVHHGEMDGSRERLQAIRAARKATGLTEARIGKLADQGKDYLDVPGFDVQSRELAGELPDLGIGIGYDPDGVDEDYGPKLWAVLSEPDPVPLAKHHPDTIRRAVELVSGGEVFAPIGPLKFSSARWAEYLARKRIPWPRLPSGSLALDDDTFKEIAKLYPCEVGPIRELRHTLGQMRLNELAVGPDGRNRVLLSPFRSMTGRNQPSNSKFIFGPSCWLRSLIRPEPGRALAYVDWSQQELGIAAALSADPRMMEAYTSGDFYLTFAKMAGAVPPEGTKRSHGLERDRFKTVSLGVLYGLSGDGLARKLGEPLHRGRELLELHRRTFRNFWAWSDATEERALLTGKLQTVFGWTLHVGRDANPRSLRNFPMQANGAEMMRLAACLATERGVHVCCPIHDAFLIEAATVDIDAEADRMADAMREASEVVLPGFSLKTDVKYVRYPDRYSDPRGIRMWTLVNRIVADIDEAGVCHL